MIQLEDYDIKGDVVELENILNSNVGLSTTLDSLLSVQSKERENYIEVGYGETLSAAFHNAPVSDRKCRLVHIFFSHDMGIGIHEFYDFIKSLEKDVIFGFSYDDTIDGVKLVMVCN